VKIDFEDIPPHTLSSVSVLRRLSWKASMRSPSLLRESNKVQG